MTTSPSSNGEFDEAQLGGYRHRLTVSLRAVEEYAGTEPSFDELFQVLGDLDAWMARMANIEAGRSVSPDLEEQIFRAAYGSRQQMHAICNLLDAAYMRALTRAENLHSPLEIAQALDIDYEHRGAILAPSDGTLSSTGGGNGNWRGERYEPRIQALLGVLQRSGIFFDHVSMTGGIVNPNMMRRISYTLLKIPGLGAEGMEVFVCDQIGEGTRVSLVPQGIDAYENSSKSELDQLPGIRKVTGQTLEQWTRDVVDHLQPHGGPTPRRVNVRAMENARRELHRQFTAREWLNLTEAQLQNITVQAQPFPILAQQLSSRTFANIQEMQLEWGVQIFGLGNEEISEALGEYRHWPRFTHVPFEDPTADWRTRMRRDFPTAHHWLAAASQTAQPSQLERARQLLYVLGFSMFTLDEPDSIVQIAERLYGPNDPAVVEARGRIHYIRIGGLPMARHERGYCLRDIQRDFQAVENLQRAGLPSIRYILTFKRAAEVQVEENADVIRRAENFRQKFPDILGQEVAFSQEEQEGLIRFAVQSQCTTDTSFTGRYATNPDPRIFYRDLFCARYVLEGMQRELERIDMALHDIAAAQDILENPANVLTPLTPLISLPQLDLTESEGIFLQMLINQGPHHHGPYEPCRFQDLVRVLDPVAQNFHERGTIRNIAQSLNRKLTENRLGSVVREADGYGFSTDNTANRWYAV